jgi:hypothetical protein
VKARNVQHESLYRALISRLDKLSLEPGDHIIVTFPDRVYEHDSVFKDAQRFAQQVANLTKHQVIIIREGVELSKHKPQSEILVRGAHDIEL